MLLAVPLMALLSQAVYPKLWLELRQLLGKSQWRVWGHLLGGGGLMFLYLALLYLAVGLVTTGGGHDAVFHVPRLHRPLLLGVLWHITLPLPLGHHGPSHGR
jgi:hypothetical protein